MSTLPMFPLGSVLLPGGMLPLHVFEPRYRALVRDCLESPDGPRFGVVLIARGHEVGGGDIRHDVGTAARIVDALELRDGRYALHCLGEERIKVRRWLDDDPYPRAEVQTWPDGAVGATPDPAALRARLTAVYELLIRLCHERGLRPPRDPLVGLPDEPEALYYAIAERMPLGEADRLGILAAPGPAERQDVLADALEGLQERVEFELSAADG